MEKILKEVCEVSDIKSSSRTVMMQINPLPLPGFEFRIVHPVA
jgi:hypothetical protein